jgi:hypothetical protein
MKFILLLILTITPFVSQANAAFSYLDTVLLTSEKLYEELEKRYKQYNTYFTNQREGGSGNSKATPILVAPTKQEAIQIFIDNHRPEIDKIRAEITSFWKDTQPDKIADFLAEFLSDKAFMELDYLNNYDDFMYDLYNRVYEGKIESSKDYDEELIQRNMKRYYASLELYKAVRLCEDLPETTWVKYSEYRGTLQDTFFKGFGKLYGAASKAAAVSSVTRQCKDVKQSFCSTQCQTKLCKRGAIHGAACKKVCQDSFSSYVPRCLAAYTSTYEGKEFPKIVLSPMLPNQALQMINDAEYARTHSERFANPKYTNVTFALEIFGVERQGKYFSLKPLP